tara:strand:+ start:208 stop:378 length:171 start_codon:yes stop_codon:yes gene_type:complete
MKTSTLEVLNEGELIFGTRTAGSYFVREYEDDAEMGGSFFKTEEEAKAHMETLTEK